MSRKWLLTIRDASWFLLKSIVLKLRCYLTTAAKSLQSCPTLCNPIDSSPSLGFSRQEHWSGLPFPSPMHESEKWKWSAQSCPTLSDLMDCSLPGLSIHGIFQARVLEWVAIVFSKESSLSPLKISFKQANDYRFKSLYITFKCSFHFNYWDWDFVD